VTVTLSPSQVVAAANIPVAQEGFHELMTTMQPANLLNKMYGVVRCHDSLSKTPKVKPEQMVVGKTCQVAWPHPRDKSFRLRDIIHNNGDLHVSVMTVALPHNEVKGEVRVPLAAALDCCAQSPNGRTYDRWFPLSIAGHAHEGGGGGGGGGVSALGPRERLPDEQDEMMSKP
jgi:hypothetical protein